MDKYEERVSRILEKKKEYDNKKKRNRKTLVQCLCIALMSAVAVAAFVVLPKRAGIVTKTENTTSDFNSQPDSETTMAENNVEEIDSTQKQLQVITQSTTNKTTGYYHETTGNEIGNEQFCPPDSDGIGGASESYIDIYETKYRCIYYTNRSSGLNTFFANLVSDEEYFEWMQQYYEKYPTGDGRFEDGEEIVEPKRMKIVDFVMYFDIPREVFEEANNTWCHSRMIKWGDVPVMNPKDYKEQEEFEVYNVDIIYTFDDEIINAYYERGEYPFDTKEEYLAAVENDGYITQTKEFIMLEGFEKVTLPALPPDTKPTYIDFDWRSKRCK